MATFDTVRLFDSELLRQRLSQLDLEEMWSKGMKGVLSLVILTLLIALTGDDLFLRCLLGECAKLSSNATNSPCRWNSRMFFWIVFFAGRSAFDRAQLDHRC